jgi:hypothetical protein
MSQPAEAAKIGRLDVIGKAKTLYSLRCDRLAVSEAGTLLAASVVGEAAKVRAFGASLHSANDGHVYKLTGLEVKDPKGRELPWSLRDRLRRAGGKYRRRHVPLGYGLVHCVVTWRDESFLASVDDETLWDRLCRPRFTTPLMRAWMPYVRETLLARQLLEYAYGCGCETGLLTATTEDLDAIVRDGCRAGRLPGFGAQQSARRGEGGRNGTARRGA